MDCKVCRSNRPCINRDICHDTGGKGTTGPDNGLCRGCHSAYQRQWEEDRRDIKLCIRCNEPLAMNRVQGESSARKNICKRKECAERCVYYTEKDGKKEFCNELRVETKKHKCYCEQHSKQERKEERARYTERKKNGETANWTTAETDHLVDLLSHYEGRKVDHKQLYDKFRKTYTRWSRESVANKIKKIRKKEKESTKKSAK